jgi:Flp pilus assembly protein TadD
MPSTLFKVMVIAGITACGSNNALARDTLKITLPRHSELSPVQRLNREGVSAVQKHQYDKAEVLFYKAYLYDPADPFTLNNLGYISELEGLLERAQTYYSLASKQSSNAIIDQSNSKQLEGKPMAVVFNGLGDVPMRVNRMNVNAMGLLAKKRGFEAVALLRNALLLDPQNPFTLNNLGVAEETVGDYDAALMNYGAAAKLHSSEPVVIALDSSWRGKPVSAMATESAKRLDERIRKMDTAEVHAVMLALHGVSATNRNEWLAARKDFLNAYSMDPTSAFSLNNRGYVAEMDGDLETAQFFYEKARTAGGSSERVGLATTRSAEGKKLTSVADQSGQQVNSELEEYSRERRRQQGPIELTPRNKAAVGVSSLSPEDPSISLIPSAAIAPVGLSAH